MGMARDELLNETAAVFGGRRLTPAIRGRLEEGLACAEEAGRLVDDGTGTLAASPSRAGRQRYRDR